MEYIEWLASAEYYVAVPLTDYDRYTRLLESSVKHYKLVLDNSTDQKLYHKALYGIVLSLHMLGRNEEGKEYAMKEPDEDRRQEMLVWCLTGDDRKKLSQEIAITYFGQFIFNLTFAQKTMEAFNAVEQILNILFPDGNMNYYHNTLQYNCISKTFLLCREEKWDEVLNELKKARYHAEEMTKVNNCEKIKFTSPLFDLVEEYHMVSDSDVTDVDEFISCLVKNNCYDPIRDREEFKVLLQK